MSTHISSRSHDLVRIVAFIALVAGLALSILGSVQAQTAVWERIDPIAPPDDFGFLDIEPDHRIPGRLYLGTDSAGIYRSDNYGSAWVQIAPGTGSCAPGVFVGSAWSVAVDRFNGAVYAVNGQSGCYPGIQKSTDGGQTWTQVIPTDGQMPLDVYQVATDPYQADHLIAAYHGPFGWSGGDNTPVIESFNGGQTWTVHPLSLGYGHYVMFMENSSTWLLGTQGRGFWRTTNNGASWSQVSTVNMSHGASQLIRFKGQWYATAETGVLRSTDGITWTLFQPLGQTGSFQGIATDGETLWTRGAAAWSGPYHPGVPMRYSTDGVTWQNGSPGMDNGPMQMAADDRYLYGANWKGGVWRLPVSGGSTATPSPSSTPVVSTFTPTQTPSATSTSPLLPTATVSTSTPTPTIASPTSIPPSLLCYQSADGGQTILRVAC